MKTITTAGRVLLTASLLATAAFGADGERCKVVTGNALWSAIGGGPGGERRVLGPTTGSLKATVTAFLTSDPAGEVQSPPPNLVVKVTSIETWVMGATDSLTFAGDATFTQVPGKPLGTVSDSLSLTVVSGTGAFAGAEGSILVTGTGYDLFGGPGKTFFDLTYRGTICKAK